MMKTEKGTPIRIIGLLFLKVVLGSATWSDEVALRVNKEGIRSRIRLTPYPKARQLWVLV